MERLHHFFLHYSVIYLSVAVLPDLALPELRPCQCACRDTECLSVNKHTHQSNSSWMWRFINTPTRDSDFEGFWSQSQTLQPLQKGEEVYDRTNKTDMGFSHHRASDSLKLKSIKISRLCFLKTQSPSWYSTHILPHSHYQHPFNWMGLGLGH